MHSKLGQNIIDKIRHKNNKCCPIKMLAKCSYAANDVLISNAETKIGKFVSIAKGVCISMSEHPTVCLSTSPFLYNKDLGYIKKCDESFCKKFSKPCEIGNDVWIGCNAFLKDGIKIGDGAIIAAGAVVTKNVPPYAIVGGVPAKIIRYRFDEKTIKKLLELKWWDLEDEIIKSLPFENVSECIKKLEKIRSN